jgi:hypothetical protein
MNKASPDGRRIFLWHGRNSVDDANRLADAIAEAAAEELFELNGQLVWLNNGRPVPVRMDALREIIARHIASVRLVRHVDGSWGCEHFSFDFPLGRNTNEEPTQQTLIDLIGKLIPRVARGPQVQHALTEQQQHEVRARSRTGEPPDRIAEAYRVDVDTIRRLARQ